MSEQYKKPLELLRYSLTFEDIMINLSRMGQKLVMWDLAVAKGIVDIQKIEYINTVIQFVNYPDNR